MYNTDILLFKKFKIHWLRTFVLITRKIAMENEISHNCMIVSTTESTCVSNALIMSSYSFLGSSTSTSLAKRTTMSKTFVGINFLNLINNWLLIDKGFIKYWNMCLSFLLKHKGKRFIQIRKKINWQNLKAQMCILLIQTFQNFDYFVFLIIILEVRSNTTLARNGTSAITNWIEVLNLFLVKI